MDQFVKFRELHDEGIFVMPNPWDRGSALILEGLGFKALATTSGGFARSIGKVDQQVTRDELLGHVSELTAILSVPLSVDAERLFPRDTGGIEESVRLLAVAGAAGCSIEDYDPSSGSIDPMDRAAEAVATASEACTDHRLFLTARAENHLYGVGSLDDTIERLIAYRHAGADALYAPGLVDLNDISRLVDALEGAPVNVLALPKGPRISELESVGVRRVSTGGALFGAAYRALRDGAVELLEHGTSCYSAR
jgi:2-methylisocitrate lyase-like PEP mutase family enzyme